MEVSTFRYICFASEFEVAFIGQSQHTFCKGLDSKSFRLFAATQFPSRLLSSAIVHNTKSSHRQLYEPMGITILQ